MTQQGSSSSNIIELEEDSFALAIALQLQEVELLESKHKGKKRADAIDDCHKALLEYKDVLSNLKRSHLDGKVAAQIEEKEQERHRVVTLNRSHAYQFADDEDFSRHLKASPSKVDPAGARLINTHELEIQGSLLDQQFIFAVEQMQNRAQKLTRWQSLVAEQDKKLQAYFEQKQQHSKDTVVEGGVLKTKNIRFDDFPSQSELSPLTVTVKSPPLPENMFSESFLRDHLNRLLDTDGNGFRIMTKSEVPNSDFTSESVIKVSSDGPIVNCIACREMHHTSGCVYTPCKHVYCPACIKQLFIRASRDESLFPPRCCLYVFPLIIIRQFVNQPLLEELLLKGLEHNSQERNYCGNQKCSTFLPLWKHNLLEDIGECPRCEKQTHLLCGQLDHPHHDCKQDHDKVQELLDMGKKKDWRICNNCRNIVELDYGCNHMECR